MLIDVLICFQIYYSIMDYLITEHDEIVGHFVSKKNSGSLVFTQYEFSAGLPPSPPSAPESAGDGALGKSRNSRAMKPLGVDVTRPPKKVNGSLVAIAVLSTIIALIICCLVAWLLILGFRGSSTHVSKIST
jgi:hypothetical protein